MRQYKSMWPLSSRVYVDDDTSIIGVVTAISFRSDIPDIEVSWFCNGDAKSAWFREGRLSRAKV